MKTFIKTSQQELKIEGARQREIDPDAGCRASVNVTMQAAVEDAKAIFSAIGKWQYICRSDEGEDIKTVDCTRYETLYEIKDHLDGTVTVTMVAPKMEEVLQILTGGAQCG